MEQTGAVRAMTGPQGDWDAATYHRISEPQVTWGRRVLARLPLRGDETVLDAGCGTGRLTAQLLERLPAGRVIAMDQSPAMLDAAREHLAPRFGDRVSFVRADLQELEDRPLAEPVDAIFSTATFHWVLDHPRLFRGLYRALRPGGWLVAQCGGGPNIKLVRDRAAALMAAPEYAPHFAGWPGPWEFADDATTAARLRAAGFVEIETGLEATPIVQPGPEEYRAYLASVVFGAHLARLPDEAARARFVAALTAQAAGDDPPYLLDYWRLNLRARRPGGRGLRTED